MHTRRFLSWITAGLLLTGCVSRTPPLPTGAVPTNTRTATATAPASASAIPPNTITPAVPPSAIPPTLSIPPAAPTSTQPPASPVPTTEPTATPAAQQAAAPTPTQESKVPRLTFIHRSGQTFLTWEERTDLNGEVYRVYRSSAPVSAEALPEARLLAQVGKDSARFYANRYRDRDGWGPRLADRYILDKGQKQLSEGTGLLVWTLAPEDFGGQASGTGYYAVTVTPLGGDETFDSDYTAGPVEESVQDPLPVEISYTPGIHPGPGGHFYIQYMDLRDWNATFHAPNATNQYYGLDPQDPNLANALAYAYDYAVFEPGADMCGGKVPDTLPVMVYLHGWRNNRYPTPFSYDNPSCAYGVYPIDETETWYFGFARNYDYRKGGIPGAGVVIENYTEQRVLRMVYDLMRDPPGPAVDAQRLYLIGHSMGGTGALAFAERYPNVFAALYAGQPMTDFRTSGGETQDWPTDVSTKWGPPELNLPIRIRAPGNWAAGLQKYNGVGVWDWQNFQASLSPGGIPGRYGDGMAPLGVDHGSLDHVIPFSTQAQPFYPLVNASRQPWGGAVFEAEHAWSIYGYLPPTLAKVNGVPFWDYRVIRDETVPGFSFLSSNDPNPPTGPTGYNQTILWSASWAAWDGAPVDEPDRWQMSFCPVASGSQQCGTGGPLTVDITPRRLQHFTVTPGVTYTWENRRVSDGQVIASGTVTADEFGLLTVKGVAVPPEGNRLQIKK